MDLRLLETRRWCTVVPDEKPTPARLRQALLRAEGQSEFSGMAVPGPPRDQSAFVVAGNDREIVVAMAFFHAPPERILTEKLPEMTDVAEICFDLRQDRIGMVQFGIGPDGNYFNTHLPYPETHDSASPLPRLKKHEAHTEYFQSGGTYAMRCRFIFAWFETAAIFCHGPVVGFNICRYRPSHGYEFSAWNYPGGNGGPDATSFGTLHRHAPDIALAGVTATLDKTTLTVAGAKRLQGTVLTPLGESIAVRNGAADLKKAVAGRYRLIPKVPGKSLEPAEYHFVVEPTRRAKPSRDFTVSATYDFPDCVMANYYTPARLDAEIAMLAGWGIDRLHWIDYSDAPSFWRMDYWGNTFTKTVRACGDIAALAARTAHAHGQQILADFKIFDLGINSFFQEGSSTVPDLEGRRKAAIPEIAAHPEWTLQPNPDWQRATAYPITRLRFYSTTPLPAIKPATVRILVSDDNRTYVPYRGPVTFGQGTVQRPHQRYTPAGNVRSEGAARNWYIELSGLQLKHKYAAVTIGGEEIFGTHRGFMVAEAEDAHGDLAPLTVATTGHRDFRDDGYFFWKEWPGWNNYTEPVLQERRWTLHNIGVTFQHAPNMPTLLEPTYAGARDIWLARISKLLAAGMDGVCIRSLNHHNGVMSWLQYAFAPIVCDTFAELYGRRPQPSFEDYERVRRIRGDAFTQFLRDAKKICAAAGKKFSVQLENGIDVPVHLDTRMQLHLDYKTWMEEGIIDEASLKDFTSHSTWVHENVLPLARRRGIPIHVTSRTLSNGFDYDGMATAPQLLTDAYRNGFAGVSFYEVQNLVELNPEGYPLAKAYAAPAIKKGVAAVRELQGGG